MHYILDMDGVVFRTTETKHKLLRGLFPPKFQADISSYNQMVGGIPRALKMDHIFREICPELKPQKQRIIEEYQTKAAAIYDAADLMRGVRRFLEKPNYSKWLATSAPVEEARTALSKRHLAKHFDRVEGYPRTKANILKEAAQASNGDLVFIGDTLSDMKVAAAMSVPFIGMADKGAVIFPKGTVIIHDFTELT